MTLLRLLMAVTLAATTGCAAAGDSPNRPMEVLSVPGLRFIAEQNGEFEQTVKTKIADALQSHSEIKGAYLVSVLYPDSTTGVVLGVVSAKEPSSAALSDIQSAFAAVASSSLSLDIVFLSRAQLDQVAAIARPFYVGP